MDLLQVRVGIQGAPYVLRQGFSENRPIQTSGAQVKNTNFGFRQVYHIFLIIPTEEVCTICVNPASSSTVWIEASWKSWKLSKIEQKINFCKNGRQKVNFWARRFQNSSFDAELNGLSNAFFRINLSVSILDLFKNGEKFKFGPSVLEGATPTQSRGNKIFCINLHGINRGVWENAKESITFSAGGHMSKNSDF